MFGLASMARRGLLGQMGGGQQMSTTGDVTQFPQYGGGTQTAGLLNDYLGNLMAPRANHMPPQLQAMQLLMQAIRDGKLGMNPQSQSQEQLQSQQQRELQQIQQPDYF
jgi:hypothetical protein